MSKPVISTKITLKDDDFDRFVDACPGKPNKALKDALAYTKFIELAKKGLREAKAGKFSKIDLDNL